jgi:uncharacterized repeat protein (TIGR03803 family)
MRHLRQRAVLIVLLGSLAVAVPSGVALQAPLRTQRVHSSPVLQPFVNSSHDTRLYTFLEGSDGANPYAGLAADKTGALYGTTSNGGGSSMCPSGGCGTVFKLTPSGSGYTESVLYRFQGYPNDGVHPFAGLITDKTGALYGTTLYGGAYTLPACQAGCGMVFKLKPTGSGYAMSFPYLFQGGSDGSGPTGVLIADKTGAFYGTTSSGGGGSACKTQGFIVGCGTVFKLTPAGSGYKESVLYSFQGGRDGAYPYAGLIADASGALYGTTVYGGIGIACRAPGCGTVFKLTPAGSGYVENILYRFRGGNDGRHPYAGLISDTSGALYGTTIYGGGTCSFSCGTVFKLTPVGSGYAESILHSFQNRDDGATPFAGLIADKTGVLYGTTAGGGSGPCRCGIVFNLAPASSGYTEQILYSFRGGNDGTGPEAGLIFRNRALYGTTAGGGGASGYGTVFKVSR